VLQCVAVCCSGKSIFPHQRLVSYEKEREINMYIGDTYIHHTRAYMDISACINICTRIRTRAHTHTHSIYKYIYICIHIYTHMCVYVCVFICTLLFQGCNTVFVESMPEIEMFTWGGMWPSGTSNMDGSTTCDMCIIVCYSVLWMDLLPVCYSVL